MYSSAFATMVPGFSRSYSLKAITVGFTKRADSHSFTLLSTCAAVRPGAGITCSKVTLLFTTGTVPALYSCFTVFSLFLNNCACTAVTDTIASSMSATIFFI